MAIIQRPAKQGGATTYQGKVALGYTKMVASEADADHDTIYAAWNGGVDTVNIHDSAVTSPKLAAGAVGTRELAEGGVATADLADGAVTELKISNDQVTTLKLADAAVTNPKLANDAVSSLKIVAGAVSTRELAEGGVWTSKLADGAVTEPKISNDQITTVKLANGAVTTPKLFDGAVTEPKISNDQITTVKLANGAVTSAKTAVNVAMQVTNSGVYTIEGSITGIATYLTIPLASYRGGHVLVWYDLTGWVGALPGGVGVIEALVSLDGVTKLRTQANGGTVVTTNCLWTIASGGVIVAGAGSPVFELKAFRVTGTADWRLQWASLTVLGLS